MFKEGVNVKNFFRRMLKNKLVHSYLARFFRLVMAIPQKLAID
jgi:hypothetical protein